MHRSITVLLIVNVVVSTIVVASSHHWFSVWVGLEMNTLSILPILCYQFSPRGVESTVKYFLVQSFSAAIILNVALIQAWLYSSWSVVQPLNVFTSFVLTLALSLKLGLFPCHYWFPDVIQGVGFVQGLVLSTWQKVAPIVVLTYVVNSLNSAMLVLISVSSVLVGGWGGLNQTQVRKVLAFSSISHIGWICSVISYSCYVSLIMLVVYVIMNSSMFLISNEFNLSSLSSLSRLAYFNSAAGSVVVLIILSLGGLPPLSGFLNKFIALECLIENGGLVASGILVLGSLLSLFFYLRIAFNSSLSFFPQHSLAMFSWRSVSLQDSGFSVLGLVLSILVSLSLFGLVCLPMLSSFLS
uniref:NADH dehydrogenase subunit 2 n=1 Tax=Poraniopsis inflata TaxID=556853 RepID=UPI0028FCB9D0|nr:NADH dehydrogenase subunit 2 [Poraniopsis inflata]WNH38684.1 NADH dehydrogenase subunit 2 [Poraniopsis inflata]